MKLFLQNKEKTVKLTFIFDTVMLKNEQGNYYAINLNYKLWKDRYLPVFKDMIVSTRCREESDLTIKSKHAYTIVNGEHVKVLPITEYHKFTDVFFRKKRVETQLEKVIEQADCVIIRLPSPLGNLACNICKRQKKKYAIEMVACPWDGYRNHGHWAGKIVAPYMWWQTKKQCQDAARVLYVTKYFLQKRYPTKGITVNASNVMIHKSDEIVLENRIKKIENNKLQYILGLVGPLELKSKGHEIALKALAILKKEYPDIKIEFVGAGEGEKLRKIAKKLKIEKNVQIKGTIPAGEEMLHWMDTLDMLLIPSFQEGLPRVLIEAMSRGCPAAGAKTGGIPELLREEMLHKPGDYKKLASDIKAVLSDKELAKELARENFSEAEQYAKETLDSRRKKFWIDFKQHEW